MIIPIIAKYYFTLITVSASEKVAPEMSIIPITKMCVYFSIINFLPNDFSLLGYEMNMLSGKLVTEGKVVKFLF